MIKLAFLCFRPPVMGPDNHATIEAVFIDEDTPILFEGFFPEGNTFLADISSESVEKSEKYTIDELFDACTFMVHTYKLIPENTIKTDEVQALIDKCVVLSSQSNCTEAIRAWKRNGGVIQI